MKPAIRAAAREALCWLYSGLIGTALALLILFIGVSVALSMTWFLSNLLK